MNLRWLCGCPKEWDLSMAEAERHPSTASNRQTPTRDNFCGESERRFGVWSSHPSFPHSLRFSRSLSVMRPFFKAHPFFGQTERASATRFPFLPCGHERRPRPPRRRRRRHSRFSSRRRRRNRLCIPDGIRAARGSLKTCLVVVFSITQGCRLTVFVD